MNGYNAISKILKKEGVDWIACFPNNPLIEAVAKEGIRPIMFRQERGGIMAADGYSRTMMGKKFGVFACQGGPGAENSYGGIAQAFADSVPIMFIPDGIPLINSDVSPSFISSKNFTDITKWSKSINDSKRIVPLMKRAFHSLKNGRPSPVLIEMHRDHMTQEISNFKQYNSPHQSKFFQRMILSNLQSNFLLNQKIQLYGQVREFFIPLQQKSLKNCRHYFQYQ